MVWMNGGGMIWFWDGVSITTNLGIRPNQGQREGYQDGQTKTDPYTGQVLLFGSKIPPKIHGLKTQLPADAYRGNESLHVTDEFTTQWVHTRVDNRRWWELQKLSWLEQVGTGGVNLKAYAYVICLYHSPPCFSRQGLSLNLEFTILTRLAELWGNKPLCPTGVTGVCHHA